MDFPEQFAMWFGQHFYEVNDWLIEPLGSLEIRHWMSHEKLRQSPLTDQGWSRESTTVIASIFYSAIMVFLFSSPQKHSLNPKAFVGVFSV